MYISKYFEQVYICCCGIEFEGTVFDSEEPCKRHKGNHGKKMQPKQEIFSDKTKWSSRPSPCPPTSLHYGILL